MAKDSFSTRIEVRGENAVLVRKVLDKKIKDDTRPSYTNAIEAIIIAWGKQKKII